MSAPVLDDVIAAIATAPGAAGLAVLRVSGPGAVDVAGRVFRGARLGDAAANTVHHGWVVGSGGQRLDEVVAAVFRAPRSYTAEDVVELSCHGGPVPARRVLEALCAAGAREARPGEFTWRAFLHGRIDLAQAEAVADLIHAQTRRAADLAVSQLSGGLSRRVRELHEGVVDARAEVEACVDFAEDVGGVEVPERVIAAIGTARQGLAELLNGAAFARVVRGGLRVALVGRPNVGKSSLFNALLGEERALVTEIPGTTRDRVSESVEIAGVRVTLSDTAGVREAEDPVERLGVERTLEALESSACVLWVVDGAAALGLEDHAVAALLRDRRVVVALNKCDQPQVVCGDDVAALLPPGTRMVRVSARTREGVASLGPALIGQEEPAGGWAVAVANPRHEESLRRADAALARAARAAAAGAPGEIVALELREAHAAMAEVTGDGVGDDLLERIFSRFCIGK